MTLLEKGEYDSVLVSLRRVTRVMKGGKRFRFSALVVVGDGNGRVGAALAKAPEAMLAIRKAEEKAKKNMFNVPIVNETIPHEIIGTNTTSKVLLKPAGSGTGIIASMPVRSVLEKAGYKNILTKSLGSNNHINLVWATLDALKKLKTKEEQLEILQSQESKDQFEKYLKPTEIKEQLKENQEKNQQANIETQKKSENQLKYEQQPKNYDKSSFKQKDNFKKHPNKPNYKKFNKPYKESQSENPENKENKNQE
jgi:small subunit ribosomal protein S5